MIQATKFEFKLWKFICDCCFITYEIDLKTAPTGDIRIERKQRSIVWKCVLRVTIIALVAKKFLPLVHRVGSGDVTPHCFFHSQIMLFIGIGLFFATAVIFTSSEALTYFNFQHEVCQRFLGE